MSKTIKKRGWPRADGPMTPAERMRAYRARKRAAGLKAVSGWVPATPDTSAPYSDHRLLEARSLALHCKIAQKINMDPGLLEIPLRNLRRWSQKTPPEQTPQYIKEWQQILTQPWPDIAAFIVSCTDKAFRLRQSSPFAGVLSHQERKHIYEAFRT